MPLITPTKSQAIPLIAPTKSQAIPLIAPTKSGPPSMESTQGERAVEAAKFAAKKLADTLRGFEAAHFAEIGDSVELENFSRFWEEAYLTGLAAKGFALERDEDDHDWDVVEAI